MADLTQLEKATTPSLAQRDPRPGRGRKLVAGLKSRPGVFIFGICAFGIILLILLLTPVVAPYDPSQQDLPNRLTGLSADHWLGTDQLGRDTLSRLMYGGRFSVFIAAFTLAIAATFGTAVGMFSARKGGAFDEIVMRISDVLLSFPEMIVALFLVSVLRPSYATLVIALTVSGWTPFARLARGLTMEINGRDFIDAAEALGCSKRFIIFRHVLPNAIAPLTAHAALRFGHILITVGALSFLGLGVQPPASDWGSMLADGQPYMIQSPILVLAPGAAIFFCALSVTFVGQGLRSRRQRKKSARVPL